MMTQDVETGAGRRGEPRRAAAIPMWIGPAYISMGLILIPWIIYLSFSLPAHETAQHYRRGLEATPFSLALWAGVRGLA